MYNDQRVFYNRNFFLFISILMMLQKDGIKMFIGFVGFFFVFWNLDSMCESFFDISCLNLFEL